MASQTEAMVAQIQQEIEALVGSVTGPQTQAATADVVELMLFRRLLALGAGLLRLFFVTRAAHRPPEPVLGKGGVRLAYHDRRPTSYYSVFGKLSFRRHAYTAAGQPVVCPLDAALSLPVRCYSTLLADWATYADTDASYRQSQTVLTRVLGLGLSLQATETLVAEAAVDVGSFLEQPPTAGQPDRADRLLVVQADGKGVPMRPVAGTTRPVRPGKGQPGGSKKEAIVTSLYTIAPAPRTPTSVLAALLHEPEVPDAGARLARPQPVDRELRATLDGKEVALRRLAARARQRDDATIQERVALTDGADALQRAMQTHLPDYPLVLDIIHGVEHLWEAANAWLGERHPERTAWVRQHLLQMLNGQTTAVIATLTEIGAAPSLSAAQRQVVQQTARYYQRNLPYMHYDVYLAKGWPIGTGVVESACGQLVRDRMEQAGMRWGKPGAQAVLDLRAVRLNGHWEAYWQWHRQQEHRRCYGSDRPPSPPAELQALGRVA
jgi:hypothetical protein